VAISDMEVAFCVRADGNGKGRVVRLPGEAFADRFLLHVLPPGFKRIRHYRLLAPAHKRAQLTAARAALAAREPEPPVIEQA